MPSLPIHARSDSPDDLPLPVVLLPRKGGGGGGGGGHGSSGGHAASEGSGSKSSGSSSGSKSSSSSSSKGSSFSLPPSSGVSGRVATAYSSGGGKPFALASSSPFSGRQAGGGTRSQVYGTSQYGSGYPYGSSGSYLDDRPLPFVFWPIPIAPHYYGSDTYTNYNGTVRPGGNLTTAIIKGNGFANTTEIYRIIGDQLSVTAVLDALVTNCTVENTTLASFDPNVYSYPQPEQIVQWYRASTFGLGLDTYNNTAALPSNMPASNNSALPPLSIATPLPAGLNMTFLQCLNATIAASVPLLEQPSSKHLSQSEITWIVLASIFGGLTLLAIVFQCCCDSSTRPAKKDTISKPKQNETASETEYA